MKSTAMAALLLLISCLTTSFSQSSRPATTTTHVTVPADIQAAAKAAATTGCNQDLWHHVYNPSRLQVIEQCIEVTGTIRDIKHEVDGDDHIQLEVDPGFSKLLNDRNVTAQANSLIVEPVCQGPDTQPDAIAACRDFHSPVKVPKESGVKVKVVGAFVWDTEADHGWTEIHPVTSMTVIQ